MKLYFKIGSETYLWGGGFGSVLKSNERGVKEGDVRYIGKEMFHAFTVYDEGYYFPRTKKTVCWVPCRDFGAKEMEEIKTNLMKVSL